MFYAHSTADASRADWEHLPDHFDFDLEAARHETAEARHVEKHLLRVVLKDTFGDVGGPVSALEAFPSSNGARLAFTYSQTSIVGDLPVLNSGLAIMPSYKAFG